jgi:hypothetical protein
VRLRPAADPLECLGYSFAGVIRDQEYVAMEFGKLPRVISSKVDEEQFARLFGWRGRRQRNVVAVGMLDGTPAIKMRAFWRSPPLAPQVVVAILGRFAN